LGDISKKGYTVTSKQELLNSIRCYLTEKFHLPDEQVGEMMPKFVVALSSHMEKIESALQSGDRVALGKSGHTMKGALLNLGLFESAELAKLIELKGKENDESVDFQGLVKKLRNTLDILIS
jgi:HPt (histidine-containing phosphotransfer) domain-containing protein